MLPRIRRMLPNLGILKAFFPFLVSELSGMTPEIYGSMFDRNRCISERFRAEPA
jgi:hypothetical protein